MVAQLEIIAVLDVQLKKVYEVFVVQADELVHARMVDQAYRHLLNLQ